MIRTRQLAVAVTALALTSVLVGCGSNKSDGAAGSGSSCTMVTAQTAAVTIKDFAFRPSCLSVAVGTTITFTNADSTTHTATASATGGFDSGDLTDGQTFSHKFTTPGTYNYICDIHQYMKGVVEVRSS